MLSALLLFLSLNAALANPISRNTDDFTILDRTTDIIEHMTGLDTSRDLKSSLIGGSDVSNASNAECTSDAFIYEISTKNNERRNVFRRTTTRGRACASPFKETEREDSLNNLNQVETQLERIPPEDDLPMRKGGRNPCEGLRREIHVTCGGPEIRNTGTNVILNCVLGKLTLHRLRRFRGFS